MKRLTLFFFPLLAGLPALSAPALGQEKADIREMKLRDWQPRSMLVTQETEVLKAAAPVFDVHNHLGGGAATLTPERVKNLLAEMDAVGVRTVVNLDGGWGPRLRNGRRWRSAPRSVLTFALLDFGEIDEPGWSDREVKRLRRKRRCQGLKFHWFRPRRPLQGRAVDAGR